ncbi:MAG: septal ring lytic transglycosylase RlpA family protein [Desulfobacterales bacterium]|nr:septal ring lytic transglycosylase RlpA family protein [Desulfobacterales bacterium]
MNYAKISFFCIFFLFINYSSVYAKPHEHDKKTNGKRRYEFRQIGSASFYGKPFHGGKTSSGECYNMNKLTAAHKTLPIGVYAIVRNIRNNKTVRVRINDRGPASKKRIIDLSYGAARVIDMVKTGTAIVEVTVPFLKASYTIQVAAFRDKKSAIELKNKLKPKYDHVEIVNSNKGRDVLYRVRAGLYHSLKEAMEHEKMMIRAGFKKAVALEE